MWSPYGCDEEISTYYLLLLFEEEREEHRFLVVEVYFGFSDACFLVAGIVGDILVSQEYARRDIYGSP